MIIFTASDHSYKSIDQKEQVKWTSVTTLVGQFKIPFDKDGIALKTSKNKKSRWFGMSIKDILAQWDISTNTALKLGSWYHDQREQDLISCNTIQRSGKDLSIISPIIEGDKKLAPDQSLVQGIYPEHMVYLKSAGVCGQADRVEIVQNTVNVYDYKTNKEIKKKGFKNWQGVVSKMLKCCSHLDDCNFNHYALQMSIYMYIILKHNPNLVPGRIVLEHIVFEVESIDQYGVPVYVYDPQGDPIVKEIVPYEIPYLKKEVMRMLEAHKKAA